jgi:hypothetical protein
MMASDQVVITVKWPNDEVKENCLDLWMTALDHLLIEDIVNVFQDYGLRLKEEDIEYVPVKNG